MATLVVALVTAAVANSVGEELLWRGCLVSETAGLHTASRYSLQVVSFGLAHYHGLPSGIVGCVLTGGCAAALLWVHQRWGMTASIVFHIVADLVIFVAVLPWVFFTSWIVVPQ
ncbi:MAG: CPBP family glutamic-type intramembrane protease [Microlunatus sp.]|nr:CPBP family glutamic-type intramembrane protease [Microlunatus sp.]